MTKNVKIAIAIGSGLVVGFGGWYLYQYIQKRNEAAKLAGLDNSTESTPSTTANLGTPITNAVPTTGQPTESSLGTPITNAVPTTGQPKLNPLITQALSVASQPTESSFNGQEMVSRYQHPFWTVGR